MEVYAIRDILLHEELGTDYGAPFWYQPHNGLTTRDQARRVQAYYQRSTLPWLLKPGTTKTPSMLQHLTLTLTALPPQPATTDGPSNFVDLAAPPGPTDKGTQLPPPAAEAPPPAPTLLLLIIEWLLRLLVLPQLLLELQLWAGQRELPPSERSGILSLRKREPASLS